MNKAKLKTYAPQARKDFIAAVTARANLLGIAEQNGQLEIAPAEKTGDLVLIAGQAWPAKVHEQRERLIQRMRKEGFVQTLEAVAYTWFNRFAALRFMEIHDYLGHGHRVLSSREGGLPEILTHATELATVLPGLNAQQIADMKLAGNKDGELYRLLLVAQCNALSNAMPFLFERIDDESELLLPGNLERTDSVVAKLVEAIPEEDWNEVEVIGWLYQFYISEKKDEVIGKVVKSEDIPAATQLFTPNWIVQYLVQNSVGRLWLMASPASSLKGQWPYYIEPAEQTPEVQAQLDALIKTRMDEDGGSLNPETITVLDPACGSGHILVEAYEVLKGIYLERGYQARSIPRLILEKNLYGLDIDDRAAQLAGFALLMKARADDRRLLETPVKLNVLSLQESAGMDLDEFAGHLKPHGINRTVLGSLLDTFTHAKTFGSLIQIPRVLEDGLAGFDDGMAKAIENGDVFAKAVVQDLVPLVQQAKILKMKFDAVVANPPYMNSKGMDAELKKFSVANYPDSKSDLFTCFIERSYTLATAGGQVAMVTMQSWMFLSSFEKMRERLIREKTIRSMVHIGFNSFPSLNSKIALATAFSIENSRIAGMNATYVDLNSAPQSADKDEVFLAQDVSHRFNLCADELKKIPGSPIAYWVSQSLRNSFDKFKPLHALATPRAGMITGNNASFVRAWHEVPIGSIGFNFKSREDAKNSSKKWFPYQKGGQIRKWSGNREHVVDWENDGARLRTTTGSSGNVPAHAFNEEYIFQPNTNWSAISIFFSARVTKCGALFDAAGSAAFPGSVEKSMFLAGFLNSKIAGTALGAINPTVNFQAWNIGNLPLDTSLLESKSFSETIWSMHDIAEADWNGFEVAWDFQSLPILQNIHNADGTLKSSYENWKNKCQKNTLELQRLEEVNNRIFIDAYGLAGELTSDVPLAHITLKTNPANRYGDTFNEGEMWERFRRESCEELISYAIGCMMGRYSLDEPGLIYASAGNVGFDATRYNTFPADADGIIPITDELWFEDDATNRIREFILTVWPASTFEENMAWLAESLGTKGNETPAETIRRYLSSSFIKDHLQTYKKRPIYWLFSSGKQGAFQALVYLHRYHEGTLARMRAEYVVPLTGKMQSRIEMLEKDKDAATSTAARNKIAKQIEALKKKHIELLAYDEKLRHYADMRIGLDLDDGVKVNYGKFGDLLAEVKAVTGGAGDE
jgi:type II restriction/modification system DNA methylase subunit YeeA